MKMNEKRRALFDAVSGIDPALVQEATAPRSARIVRTVWRVAAAAAMVAIMIGALAGLPLGIGGDEEYVTAPGLLSIRAYALDENEISEVNSTVLKEGVELPWEYAWSSGYSMVPLCYGLPITLDFPEDGYDDAEITFEIAAIGGSFQKRPEHYFDPTSNQIIGDNNFRIGSDITVNNHTTVYWNWEYVNYDGKKDTYLFAGEYAEGSSYIDIIIRADNVIIGYAVVEIYELYDDGVRTFSYNARVLEIVAFPKVDGAFQPVTIGYVNRQLEALHQSN